MPRRRFFRHLAQLCALAVLAAPLAPLSGAGMEELRLSVGSKLFPSLLAADLGLTQKRLDDQRLRIVILYQRSPRSAELVSKQLYTVDAVQGMALKIELLTLEDLLSTEQPPTAGLFLSERLYDELPRLMAWAAKTQTLIFSPFEGDVERGVHGGILVRDRILPYVNLRSLRADQIQLKEFFLKVAERYE